MDLIEVRRRILMLPHIKTYGGIPVLYDNAYYGPGNGLIGAYSTSNKFFLTVVFDTGTSSSKSYTMPQYNKTHIDVTFDAYGRWFNNLTSTSKDYWGITTGGNSTSRTFSSQGQYIVACVYKPEAADFYIYDNTNGRYVVKGKNVT